MPQVREVKKLYELLQEHSENGHTITTYSDNDEPLHVVVVEPDEPDDDGFEMEPTILLYQGSYDTVNPVLICMSLAQAKGLRICINTAEAM